MAHTPWGIAWWEAGPGYHPPLRLPMLTPVALGEEAQGPAHQGYCITMSEMP